MQISLYIHIPFCNSFCDYCDFYSIDKNSVDDKFIDEFLSALISDIKSQIEFFDVKKIPAAYIGGGTPSVLGEKIRPLFDALKTIPAFSPEEFTIEANPESLTEGFLNACLEGGVNRLSLGAQTFHEPSRDAVNRKGSRALLEERLALASRFFSGAKTGKTRETSPQNARETSLRKTLSVDLITGLPFQNEEIVLEDIKRLISFEPDHVSLYSLSVESGVPLEEKLKTKTVALPDSDNADSLWLSGRDALLKAGYEHYEVSNFALVTSPLNAFNKNRCVHNTCYWQMESWLGAGPAASGTAVNEETGTARRFTFARDTETYIKEQRTMNKEQFLIGCKIVECEELDRDAFLKDCLLMGFRCKEGPDPQKFYRRFGITVDDCIPETLARWKDKDKMLFLNRFLSEAFNELKPLNLG